MISEFHLTKAAVPNAGLGRLLSGTLIPENPNVKVQIVDGKADAHIVKA